MNCDLRRCTPLYIFSYYRASDVHGTYYSWITSSSSVLFSGGQARHLRLSCYHGLLLDYSSWFTRALLTCTACTFSVSQLWISSLTVHLICTAYTFISMRSIRREVRHLPSSGYLEYDYYYIVFVYYSLSSSLGEDLRCGHLLWMPTFFCFCPVPD